MITSGCVSRTRSTTSRCCSGSAALTSPSERPSVASSAPQSSAARFASALRMRATSSQVWTKLPRLPVVAWHITTSCPSCTYRASVPPHRISRSSGCAPTANTLIRDSWMDVPSWQRRRTHGQSPYVLRSAPTSGASNELQSREVEERLLHLLQREPHAAERDRLVAERREDHLRRDRDEAAD